MKEKRKNYYMEKVEAWHLIDKWYSEGMHRTIICYKISLMFGFSERFVDNRIELLEKMAKLQEEKDVSKKTI